MPNTLLFAWNPGKNKWSLEDVGYYAARRRAGRRVELDWNCASWRHVAPGDRAFLIKLGAEPRGIIGSGYITAGPYTTDERNRSGRRIRFVDICMDTLLDPRSNPILAIADLMGNRQLRDTYWTIQQSGIRIKAAAADVLEDAWKAYSNANRPVQAPDEALGGEPLREGLLKRVTVNVFERNPKARDSCLAHHKTRCCVCGIDLAAAYGLKDRVIIHVHHVVPLSTIKRGYEVDPIRDLRPVCPNCHAVIHSQEPPYSLKQVERMWKRAQAATKAAKR